MYYEVYENEKLETMNGNKKGDNSCRPCLFHKILKLASK